MKTLSYVLGLSVVILIVIALSSMIKKNIKMSNPQKVRLSRLVIDSEQLATYWR